MSRARPKSECAGGAVRGWSGHRGTSELQPVGMSPGFAYRSPRQSAPGDLTGKSPPVGLSQSCKALGTPHESRRDPVEPLLGMHSTQSPGKGREQGGNRAQMSASILMRLRECSGQLCCSHAPGEDPEQSQQSWVWIPGYGQPHPSSSSHVLLVSALLFTHSFNKSLQSAKARSCRVPRLSMGSSWSSWGPGGPVLPGFSSWCPEMQAWWPLDWNSPPSGQGEDQTLDSGGIFKSTCRTHVMK